MDNTITLVGNVVSDPELRIVGDGVCLARLRVASSTRFRDRATGEWRDGSTLFVTVTCWRKLAENVSSSLAKGLPVIVVGRLSARTYEADGQRRTVYEVDAVAIGPDLARASASVERTGHGRDGVEELEPVDAVLAQVA